MEPDEYLAEYTQPIADRRKTNPAGEMAKPRPHLPEQYYFEDRIDHYLDTLNRSELLQLFLTLVPEEDRRFTPNELQSRLQEKQRQLMALSDWATGLKRDLRAKEEQLADSHRELVKLSDWATELQGTVRLMESSLSWRLTRPLRTLKRQAELLRKARAEGNLRAFLASRLSRGFHRLPLSARGRWWLQSAVYELLGRVNPDSGRYRFYLREKALRRERAGQISTGAELAKLPPPQSADIFLWGVIDWHFRIQRPQHLARSFAERGYRVFYFSPQFIDDPEPGFAVEALDSQGGLFCLRLHVKGAPVIYHGPPAVETLEQLRLGMSVFLQWTESKQTVSLVQHPFWYSLAGTLPNNRLVYDCMDHHDGFGNTAPEILSIEKVLVNRADLLVVTSQWLYDTLHPFNPSITLIRNACDYTHFATRPETVFQDPHGRRIIGYYGAIAEWFDLELLGKMAQEFADCLILLVGADTCGAASRLGRFANVVLTGEVSYQELPHYLHAMDLCVIPFKVIPLTLATNPVKAYEYLSAGKPVVAVDLPELHSFQGNIQIAASHEHFLALVKHELAEEQSIGIQQRRRAFAAGQTWQQRIQALAGSLQQLRDPLVSVIVITYNNLELTKACLASLVDYSDYANYEVIVIDNASADGSADYLVEFAQANANFRVILNDENRGFAAANNQGLAESAGDFIVLLNNDTVVTSAWIGNMLRHFRHDPRIGILGPITNNIGNEARVATRYTDLAAMHQEARRITLQNMGKSFDIRTLAFFCVMLPRPVYTRVGFLDESFGTGFFEDDDYCRRIEQLGYRIVCAEDVFIHHHLSAAFDKMDQTRRRELFERNKQLYEQKWGEWIPHQYR